jgi:hypothetical protein
VHAERSPVILVDVGTSLSGSDVRTTCRRNATHGDRPYVISRRQRLAATARVGKGARKKSRLTIQRRNRVAIEAVQAVQRMAVGEYEIEVDGIGRKVKVDLRARSVW